MATNHWRIVGSQLPKMLKPGWHGGLRRAWRYAVNGTHHLSKEEFRLTIAGLQTTESPTSQAETETFKNLAINWSCCLARVFSDDLDRKTLWERIGTALDTACAKHPDDTAAWANATLEHVKADFGKAAASKGLETTLADLERFRDADARRFITYVKLRKFIVVAHARAAWQDLKELGEA